MSEWYEKAANQGGAETQYNFGAIYYENEEGRQNTDAAKQYFGKAYDIDDQEGCDGYRTLNQR